MIFLQALLALLLPLALCAPPDVLKLDSDENENLESFETEFHLPNITDPVEKAERQEALKANEDTIIEENQEFLEGKKTWSDALNKFSDLTKEEFEQDKTGLQGEKAEERQRKYARGLIMPTGPIEPCAASEAYFAAIRKSMRRNRASVPSSFSAVDAGFVSPVKDQKECGSCVAYASMATVETCFKKKTGVFGDYSEQQMVDCGYEGHYGAGCNGAPIQAYGQLIKEAGITLVSEVAYPYKNTHPKLKCPKDVKGYNQGAEVSGFYYTYNGDEETLKALVAKKGAVISGVHAAGELQSYSGGIFSGCKKNTSVDHAITVVGYGTEKGLDYWLIKNSWGSDWGEDGFFRLEREKGACVASGASWSLSSVRKWPDPPTQRSPRRRHALTGTATARKLPHGAASCRPTRRAVPRAVGPALDSPQLPQQPATTSITTAHNSACIHRFLETVRNPAGAARTGLDWLPYL